MDSACRIEIQSTLAGVESGRCSRYLVGGFASVTQGGRGHWKCPQM